MAQVDTSIYANLLRAPKSVADYDAEYQQGQANKLAMLTNQAQYDQMQRGIERQNKLSSLVGGFGQDDAANVNRLYQGGFFGEAQDYAKNAAQVAKTRAETGKTAVDTEKAKFQTAKEQLQLIVDVASSASDPASYAQGRALLQAQGIDVSSIPEQFDPAYVQQAGQMAMSQLQRVEQAAKERGYQLDVQKFQETKRSNLAGEAVQRGQLAVAQGNLSARQQEVAMGGKPPPGFRWKGDGTLEAIPGGPGDKLPEAQQKQVVGVQNLSNAITEYRQALKGFSKLDNLSPDARAKMGTKYNNMMLQAKEAYNLGVLNGPDFEILQSVITDPRSLTGFITSKGALDSQASELDRIMSGVAATSGNRRPQDGAPLVSKPKSAPANIDDLLKKYGD